MDDPYDGIEYLNSPAARQAEWERRREATAKVAERLIDKPGTLEAIARRINEEEPEYWI